MSVTVTSLRKRLSVVLVSAASILAGAAGWNLLQHGQFARAEQQAAGPTTREVSAVEGLSGVFRDVGRAVGPSVVRIDVTKTVTQPDEGASRRFRGPGESGNDDNGGEQDLPPDLRDWLRRFGQGDEGARPFRQRGTGSGVIMEATGGTAYILTNNHVVGGASEVNVTLADGRRISNVKVVGADPQTDVAVVQIKADNVTPAKWGDSGTLQQGDWVLAFGAPFGYVGSMTHGIVSALHREAGILGQMGYESFIQVDAPVNPGNSGGPLVNIRGEVVGINIAIATENGGFQGIGFAVPSTQARQIYQTLKDKGKVVRGWLGVQIADVAKLPEEAKAAGYQGNTGVLVKGVLRNTPAAGKLEPGDVITGLNGKPVTNSQELRNAVAMTPPNTNVTLDVVRNGKQQRVPIEIGQQPTGPSLLSERGPQQEEQQKQMLGMRLTDLTPQLAQRYGLAAKSGALVTAVQRNSPAAEAGVSPGDVITRIDDQPIKSAEDASKILSKADLAKGVRLFITNREGSSMAFLRSGQ